MNPKDPMGWDLRMIFSQTALVEGRDFMFPPEDDFNRGAEKSKLNRIYNAMDVFLTTTTGEGWGLTITEAMACGVPVIAPAHTSINEITDGGKRAYLLETLYPIVAMVDNTIRFQSDLYEIADTIKVVAEEKAATKPEYVSRIHAAIDYTKSLSWNWIAEKFASDFERILKIENP